jgi:hypothetical protein
VFYSAGVFVNNVVGTTTLTPAAGDTIVLTVSESATKTTVTVKDVTQAKTVTGSAATGGTPALVFDGMSNVPVQPPTTPPTYYPIPNFGHVTFSAAKLDGKTPLAAAATAFNLVKGTVTQILAGPLSLTGNSWKDTFKHK